MQKSFAILLLLFTSLFFIQATFPDGPTEPQVFLNQVEMPVGIEAADEQKLQQAIQQLQAEIIKADNQPFHPPAPVDTPIVPEEEVKPQEEPQEERQWGGRHHKKCHDRFKNMTEEQKMEFWKQKREHHGRHGGHHGRHHRKHENDEQNQQYFQSPEEVQSQFLQEQYMTNFQQEAPVPPEQDDHQHRFKHWKKFHKRKCRKVLAVVIGVILLCCLCCICRKIIKKCKKCHKDRKCKCCRCCRRCRCERESPSQGQQQQNNSFNVLQTSESFEQPQVLSVQPPQIYPQLNVQQQQPRYIPSHIYQQQQQQQPVYQYPVFVNNQLSSLPVGVPAQFDRRQQM